MRVVSYGPPALPVRVNDLGLSIADARVLFPLGMTHLLNGSLKRPRERASMNAKQAWAVMAAGIVLYELTSRDGELLSEQCDRWLESNPTRFLTRAVIATVSLHLANVLPDRFDPMSQDFWKMASRLIQGAALR